MATLAVLAAASLLTAQAAEQKTDSFIGEVTSVEAGERLLTVKADTGEAFEVSVAGDASILRAKPGAKSLGDAVAAPFEEIAVGDRVLVRGARSKEGTSLAATRVVVMAKDDIVRKQEAERADWRRRGMLGTVTAVDPSTGAITLQVGRGPTARTLELPTEGRAIAYRRYAPDSVKFSDAKPSSLAELKVGDELRALGDRSPDEKSLLAEEVVFGAFRQVVARITSVEAAKSEVTVRDEESGKKLVVAVGPEARLRHLPPEMAARFARRRAPGEASEGGAARPDGAGAPRAGWGRGPGGGAEDILERMPATTLADLKVGDRILVSSTRGGDASRLTAIALVSGLEAITPPQASGRAARGPESGLPSELMDLGMSIQ